MKNILLIQSSPGGLESYAQVYSDGPAKPLDFQEPYLRAILGFIGLTAIDVARVEGVAVGAIGPEKAAASAMARSREILTQVA